MAQRRVSLAEAESQVAQKAQKDPPKRRGRGPLYSIDSATNRDPDMLLFLATQKDQKHPRFSPRCFFFHLIRGFQKHPKVSNTYLIKEHLDVKKKASQHFETLVTLV